MIYRIWNGREIVESTEPAQDGETELRASPWYDCDGQPIYECDILETDKGRGVVECAGESFVVRVRGRAITLGDAARYSTVVGNAFENSP